MVKKLLILSLLTILCFESFPQTDFREGHIVTNNNDTIRGLIDYKGNISNATKCIFKKDITSASLEYSPSQIKAYQYTDSKCYVSKNVKMGGVEEFKFLEYLINGIVDVFYYRDTVGEHYFVENDDGRLSYLNNDPKELFVDNKKYIGRSKEYVGLLRYTFKESPTISRQLDEMKLDHKSLISISDKYHSEVCSTEECIIYEKKIPKEKWVFGTLTGFNSTFITLSKRLSPENDYLEYTRLLPDSYLNLGMFVKMNMPGINERLHLQYEATFNYRSLVTDDESSKDQTGYRTQMKLTHGALNNSLLVRYEFPKGKWRPVFHLGVFTNHFFNISHETTVILRKSYETPNRENEYEVENTPFGDLDYGFSAGAGSIVKALKGRNVYVDLRYQRGFGWLEGVSSNTLSFNIGIQINR